MKIIRKILNFLEYLFVMASLILYMGGVLNVILADGVSEGDLNAAQATDVDNFAIVKIIYPITYLIALLLLTKIVVKSGRISDIFLRNSYVLIPVVFAVISVVWSELPEITMSRSFALVGTTIFGIYLANRFTLKEQIVLLGRTFLVTVLLCLFFVVALPKYGVMGGVHEGALRGIFSHKNDLGRLMALSTIIFAMQPGKLFSPNTFRPESTFFNIDRKTTNLITGGKRSKQNENPYWFLNFGHNIQTYLGLILSVLMLTLARSSGAIVVAIIMLTVLAIFKISQLSSWQRFFAILGTVTIFCILGVVVLPDPEILFASMGKSSDLSGRSDLWDLLLDTLAKNNPFLGFGYGTFWLQYQQVLAAYNRGWAAPDAHNGFLDLTLSIGLFGLALFVLSYIYTFSKGLNNFRYQKTDEQLWPLVLLAYLVMTSLSETGLFAYNNIFWLLYITIAYSVIPRKEQQILALPESRIHKPMLALPPSKMGDRKALPSSARQGKTFLALPESRDRQNRQNRP